MNSICNDIFTSSATGDVFQRLFPLQRHMQVHCPPLSERTLDTVHVLWTCFVKCTFVMHVTCTLRVHCALCIGVWTGSVHCTCTVHFLVYLKRTVHVKISVCGASAMYIVQQVHRTMHFQHTARAYSIVRSSVYTTRALCTC